MVCVNSYPQHPTDAYLTCGHHHQGGRLYSHFGQKYVPVSRESDYGHTHHGQETSTCALNNTSLPPLKLNCFVSPSHQTCCTGSKQTPVYHVPYSATLIPPSMPCFSTQFKNTLHTPLSINEHVHASHQTYFEPRIRGF